MRVNIANKNLLAYLQDLASVMIVYNETPDLHYVVFFNTFSTGMTIFSYRSIFKLSQSYVCRISAIGAGADYVFSVKKNQKELYSDVAEMIDFKLTDKYELLNAPLEKVTKTEKTHGRIDKRTAFVTHEVEWLQAFNKWHGIQSLGAVVTESETRYYISSRKLSPLELLTIARNEWAVESMHWQLDVIFNEDRTTLHEQNSQKTLNILRKTVLNIVRTYRDRFQPKLNMVDIMRKCLHDSDILLDVLAKFAICV